MTRRTLTALSLATLITTPVGAAPSSTTRLSVESKGQRLFDYELTPEVFDLRYKPYRWQGSICLPDDPHKSIVGSDGALYYDFGRGRMYRFHTRVRGGIAGVPQLTLEEQSLPDPRVPIVLTRQAGDGLILTSKAWAAAPELEGVTAWKETRHDYLWLKLENPGRRARSAQLVVEVAPRVPLVLDESGARLVEAENPERVFCQFWPRPERVELPEPERLALRTEPRIERNWARPPEGTAPAFRHVIVGSGVPLEFEFPAAPGARYRVAFGLIEGWHTEPGVRPLEVWVEGKPVAHPDPIRDVGRNRPLLIWADASDENGDGRIALSVRAAKTDFDRNTILSALWVFPAGQAPPDRALLSGQAAPQAWAYLDADVFEAGRNITAHFAGGALAPGASRQALVAVHRGAAAAPRAASARSAAREEKRALAYWKKLDLPYDRMNIPDRPLQALLDSCIRNIYQARELRDGRPAFQVGPTYYRGTWAADGPFILEGVTYLGRWRETRAGLELQVDRDEGPGGVQFCKKYGLRLWMILRHAQLTGDLEWLRGMWGRVEQNVALIKEARAATRDDPSAVNYGLTPPGYPDGGLHGPLREYSNVYWTLAGLRAAIEIADALKEEKAAADWRAEFADYWAVFDRARNRDRLVDDAGNTYVPTVMRGEPPQLPQRAQWAFMQSLFPGRIFAPDDPLMLGTMAMLSATEEQGLVFGTGWIADGIWGYAASFYGHAHLWLGHGDKTAAILYAFANHASPQLNWVEEQNLVGQPERYNGDMPHNWASGEFLRMVRHMLILERGRQLHLLEGLPRAWTRPGDKTRLVGIPTSFGDCSLELTLDRQGRSATLRFTPPAREAMESVVVHTERFARPVQGMVLNGKPLAAEAEIATDRPFTLKLLFQ